VEAAIVTPPSFACVVAADEQRCIGRDNDLPWPRLRGDVAHFKAITTRTRQPGAHNAVIMGRRTWDSVPPRLRPLSGRLNVVVSRGRPALPDGVVLAGGLDQALAAATAAGAETLYLVGGGTLYAEAVADPRCELVYYTRIAARFDGDSFFPPFEHAYVLEAADPPIREGEIRYDIERWRRR